MRNIWRPAGLGDYRTQWRDHRLRRNKHSSVLTRTMREWTERVRRARGREEAVKQPLLPWLRVRHTEVLVVELRHRRREVHRVMCELEGESIRPCLPRAGPPQLERPERERDEAEHRRQEREPGQVADRPDSERRIQNPIDPRRNRQDYERRQRTQHEAAERIEELLVGELVREDGLHLLRAKVTEERIRDHDAPCP